MKLSHRVRNEVKIQSKRNVELWIYSFADMYMILSVFFIALAVLYAAKTKQQMESQIPSAGRGPASVESLISVSFDKGSAALNEESLKDLELLLPVLKASKKGTVEVEGYADSEPLKRDSEFSSNLDLSNQRAVKVAEWLINQGVSSARLRTFSYGSSRIYKVDDKMMPTNRRVLVKLVSSGG